MSIATTQPRKGTTNGLAFQALTSAIGVEARGLDPNQCRAQQDFEALRLALHRHSMLLIRGMTFDAPALARFAAGFGPLQRFAPMQPRSKEHAERYLCADAPDISRIGNLQINGRPAAADSNGVTDWHIDNLYKTAPHEATALYAVRTPAKGGDTLFASLQASYDALDRPTKEEVDTLRCVYSVEKLHDLLYGEDRSRALLKPDTLAANPPAIHPLVRVHPVTGCKGLLLGPQIMSHIAGMGEESSHSLVNRLKTHALRPELQYRHHWKNGDFLIFDNLSTLHAATKFDAASERRLLYRAMIAEVR